MQASSRSDRASPKSSSFTRPAGASSQMLAGLTSRWTSPAPWATASPAAISRPIRSAARIGTSGSRSSQAWSDRPRSSSMARNWMPSSSPTS
nr:hypothetical protein [Aquisphaera giovannonii]